MTCLCNSWTLSFKESVSDCQFCLGTEKFQNPQFWKPVNFVYSISQTYHCQFVKLVWAKSFLFLQLTFLGSITRERKIIILHYRICPWRGHRPFPPRSQNKAPSFADGATSPGWYPSVFLLRQKYFLNEAVSLPDGITGPGC